jgi:hypothetical protein
MYSDASKIGGNNVIQKDERRAQILSNVKQDGLQYVTCNLNNLKVRISSHLGNYLIEYGP